MSLSAWCPRCREPLDVTGASDDPGCARHGSQPPLWRPDEASYDSFARHLLMADGFPTYLPWPMGSGWRVSDFGVVAAQSGRPVATVTCCTGATGPDGPVDVMVITEEVGVGVGARCAGLERGDPGAEVGQDQPFVRVRIGSQGVPLWSVSTSAASVELDRSVLAGEAEGRWLWLVLLPASAILLFKDEWILRDVSGDGPSLVAMPIEGPGPIW